ncbi:MAG TPA: RNHCP domain-containing protein [Patescibacteria group bacterium]|nr:RNHCP domain-containing protein [Patescibacteria group bacterium]
MNTSAVFSCCHCGSEVISVGLIGTHNRNHCPSCLWSKHVDEKTGDRSASCQGCMKPIGLTFKKEGKRNGELMLVHECPKCGKISINRIAADDEVEKIQKLFEESLSVPSVVREKLQESGIELLSQEDRDEFYTQLFGK